MENIELNSFYHLLITLLPTALFIKTCLPPSGLFGLLLAMACIVYMNYYYYWLPRLLDAWPMLWATGWSCVSFVKFLVFVWFSEEGLEIYSGRLFWNLISCYFFMLLILAYCYYMISGSWILYCNSVTFFCSSLDWFLPDPPKLLVLVLEAFCISSYYPLGWKLC